MPQHLHGTFLAVLPTFYSLIDLIVNTSLHCQCQSRSSSRMVKFLISYMLVTMVKSNSVKTFFNYTSGKALEWEMFQVSFSFLKLNPVTFTE
jgi:hypothetical protein